MTTEQKDKNALASWRNAQRLNRLFAVLAALTLGTIALCLWL